MMLLNSLISWHREEELNQAMLVPACYTTRAMTTIEAGKARTHPNLWSQNMILNSRGKVPSEEFLKKVFLIHNTPKLPTNQL